MPGLTLLHRGNSMYPLLRSGDILDISPLQGSSPHRGDVIAALPPGEELTVVHRVTGVTPEGIVTRGDNVRETDDWLLTAGDIIGRVTAFRRGCRMTPVANGFRGMLKAAKAQAVKRVREILAPPLRPLFHLFSRNAPLSFLLPDNLRPRVVVYAHAEGSSRKLFLGRQPVGRYDEARDEWRIGRFTRFFVDPAKLPRSVKRQP